MDQNQMYMLVGSEDESNVPISVYMNVGAHDKTFFESSEDARRSNCHGIYEDKLKYRVCRVKLVVIEEDCDRPTDEDRVILEKKAEVDRLFRERIEGLSLSEKFEAIFLRDVFFSNDIADLGKQE